MRRSDTSEDATDQRRVLFAASQEPVTPGESGTDAVALASEARKEASRMDERHVGRVLGKDKGLALYKTMFEAAPCACLLANEQGVVLQANKLARQTLRASEGELAGKPLDFLLPANQREAFNSWFAKGLEEVETPPLDLLLGSDGTQSRWIRFSQQPLEQDDHAGQLTWLYAQPLPDPGLTATIDSEDCFRSIVEGCPDVVWIADASMRVRYVSPSVRNLLEYSPETFLTLDVRDILAPDSLALIEASLTRFLLREEQGERGEQAQLLELELLHRRGRSVWAELAILPLRDQKGRLVGFQGMARNISERRQNRQALEDSECMFRSLVNAASESALLLDLSGHVLAANSIGSWAAGLAMDDAPEKTLADILPDSIREQRLAHFDEVIQGKRAVRFQDECQGVFYDNLFSPIHNARGSVERVACFSRDVTEARLTHEALNLRLESEKALALCARELLARSNTEEALNRALEELLWVEDVSRVSIFENFHEQNGRLCCRLVSEVTAPGVPPQINNPRLGHLSYDDALNRWPSQLARGYPIFGLLENFPAVEREVLKPLGCLSLLLLPIFIRGRWYGFIGFDSITRRREWKEADLLLLQATAEIVGAYLAQRRDQEMLRQSQNRYRLATEAAKIGVWDFDEATGRLSIDPVVHSLLGYTSEELPNTHDNLLAYAHPEDQQRILNAVAKNLKGLTPEFSTELRMRRHDGSYCWMLVRGRTLRDGHDQTMRMVGTCFDVTERKRIEEELIHAKITAEDADRAKSEFLATMSHEIRTPVAGILGLLEVVLEQNIPERRHLEMIRGQAKSLLEILNDILDLSKIAARKLEIRTRDFELRPLLDDLIQAFTPGALAKRLQLSLVVAEGLASRVHGDPGRLGQILRNLLSNAVKFTDKGQIVLEVAPMPHQDKEQWLRFCVRDTGRGIPANKLHLLFQPFGQLDKDYAKRFGGTGLGLAISKHLAEMMAGDIQVESDPDRGAAFTLVLPLAPARNEREVKVKQTLNPSDTPIAPMNILVAEDNPVNQIYIAHFLRNMGHHPVTVANGREALTMLAQRFFDLVLMDVQMPVMNGIQATRAIRSNNDGTLPANIPVVALTAYAMDGDRERFIAAGMDDYVSKPVELDELAMVLRRQATAKPKTHIEKNGEDKDGDDKRVRRHLAGYRHNTDVLIEIVEYFLSDVPTKTRDLERALQERKGSQAVDLAHSLANSALAMRAAASGGLALKIEQAAQGQRFDEALELFYGLRNHLDEVVRYLREVLPELRERKG